MGFNSGFNGLTERCINHFTACIVKWGEIIISWGDVVKEVGVSYGNITTTGWKWHGSEIHNCPLSLKILPYHVQASGACCRKGETNQTLSIQKVQSPCISLQQFTVKSWHLQCWNRFVWCHVEIIAVWTEHTHSHLQWERLAISPLKISAHGRSWTQTHTQLH